MGRRTERMNRGLRRGAYLVPSLFTIGNAMLGFYAVVKALNGRFAAAALLVFAAGIVDGIDGYVARLTRTESDFGREFDSLADVLTFGAAPALLGVLWFFGSYGRLGWLVPLFYLLCTATRLARFNVQVHTVDSRYFVGLPAPAAAAAVASAFLFNEALGRPATDYLLLAGLPLIGGLMVSTFRYGSIKKLTLKRRWSYRSAILVALALLLLAYRPRLSLAILALGYAVSGPLNWLFLRSRRGDHPAPPPKETA